MAARHSFMAAATCAVLTVGTGHAQQPGPQVPLASPQEVQQQGRLLRARIDQAYSDLKRRSALKINGKGINDITPAFLPFIGVGMSFEEAGAILRSAGFDVGRFGEHMAYPNGIYAEIDNYASSGLFTTTAVTFIMLQGPSGRIGQFKGSVVLQAL